jgi:primary-amine oxidase
MAAPHPLSALTIRETNLARDIVKASHPGALLFFRQSYLFEPPKEEVLKFLELEHSGALTTSSPRPDRCAQVFYDVIGGDQKSQYYESVVDVTKRSIVAQEIISEEHQASLTT